MQCNTKNWIPSNPVLGSHSPAGSFPSCTAQLLYEEIPRVCSSRQLAERSWGQSLPSPFILVSGKIGLFCWAMPPASNAQSLLRHSSLRNGMMAMCFGTHCCYMFNPAVKIWPSAANLPKIKLRRQRKASWHHLGQAFAADVDPWVGRRAQGQGLAGTWCVSGLTPSLCWFFNPQALIMEGKA